MRGIISGLGAAGGALLLYSALREKKKVAASWTVPHVPPEELHPKWDYNWDRWDASWFEFTQSRFSSKWEGAIIPALLWSKISFIIFN
jgi:hypothetical protein